MKRASDYCAPPPKDVRMNELPRGLFVYVVGSW